jgi:hypothetical protein
LIRRTRADRAAAAGEGELVDCVVAAADSDAGAALSDAEPQPASSTTVPSASATSARIASL